MNKEELYGCYIATKNITSKDEWNKITDKLISLGFGEAGVDRGFKCIKSWPKLSIEKDDRFLLRCEGTGSKEIKVFDILGEETKFKVGKWYSFYWNWSSGYPHIGKVSRIYTCGNSTTICFNYSISINLSSDLNTKEKSIDLAEIENIKELTLEEIQQYLSDGHPDKILKELPKVEEPKTLTVDNLVEGEIYYCENTYLTGGRHGYVFLKNGDNGIKHLVIGGLKFLKKGWSFWTDKNTINLRAAAPEEKHWLITCIEQDKFIPKENLSKYDSEGNLISEFKVGDWVIGKENFFPESAKYVLSIKKGEAKYSDSNDGRINNRCLFKYLRHATLEEIAKVSKPKTKESKEMQLFDLKNPIFNVGDKVRVITDSLREFNDSWTKGNNTNYKKGYIGTITDITSSGNNAVNTWCYLEDSVSGISCNLLELVEPAKSSEPKEFNRDWYVKVGSQGEWQLLCDYLESIGEKVSRTDDVDFSAKGSWPYVIFNKTWQLKKEVPNLLQKQLSDILPDYSKVDRNVYYEVETQEQYNEILDWLESKGEQVNKGYGVIDSWKYICFKNSEWGLNRRVESQLSKAEFQFKSKPETQPIKTGVSIRDQITQYQNQYEYKIIDSSSVWEVLMNPPTQNSMAELKQESKVQNFIPEIPKVKNRFKTSPIKKRSLPEIY